MTNTKKFRKDLDKEIDKLLKEHCDNCEVNYVCNSCFPNFIDLALRRQHEALLKDVDELDEGKGTEADIIYKIKQLLKGEVKNG